MHPFENLEELRVITYSTGTQVEIGTRNHTIVQEWSQNKVEKEIRLELSICIVVIYFLFN